MFIINHCIHRRLDFYKVSSILQKYFDLNDTSHATFGDPKIFGLFGNELTLYDMM